MTRELLAPNGLEPWREEGFTLIEVLVTILILGSLTGIAFSFWWDAVEARKVDSAANQLVGDLRRAHASSTSRLAPRLVVTDTVTPNTYQTGPAGVLVTRTLPEGTGTATAATITFCPDGSAELVSLSPSCPNGTAAQGNPADASITVQADDGEPSATVRLTAATSRIKLD
jgi:prepilin-type N-terminal cleavage/methylation domain-containing protein